MSYGLNVKKLLRGGAVIYGRPWHHGIHVWRRGDLQLTGSDIGYSGGSVQRTNGIMPIEWLLQFSYCSPNFSKWKIAVHLKKFLKLKTLRVKNWTQNFVSKKLWFVFCLYLCFLLKKTSLASGYSLNFL